MTNGGENLMGQTVTNDEEKTNPAFFEKAKQKQTNNFWNSKQTKWSSLNFDQHPLHVAKIDFCIELERALIVEL